MASEVKLTENISWAKIKNNLTSMVKTEGVQDYYLGTVNKVDGFDAGRIVDSKNSLFLPTMTMNRNGLLFGDEEEVYKKEDLADFFNKNLKQYKFICLTSQKFSFNDTMTIEQNGLNKIYLDFNTYNFIELVSLFSTLEPEEADPEEKAMWHKKYVDFIMALSRIIFELGQREKIDFLFIKSKMSFKYLMSILEKPDLSVSGKGIVFKYLKSLSGFEEKNFFIAEEIHNYLANKVLGAFQKLTEIYSDKVSDLTTAKIISNGNYQVVIYKKNQASLFFLQELRLNVDKKLISLDKEKQNTNKEVKKDNKPELLSPSIVLFNNVILPKNLDKLVNQLNLLNSSVWFTQETNNETLTAISYGMKVYFKNTDIQKFKKNNIENLEQDILWLEKLQNLKPKEAIFQCNEQKFHVFVNK